MDREQTEHIFRECPLLFKCSDAKSGTTPSIPGFECGNGWFELLLELSRSLELIINQLKLSGVKEEELPYALQVKQKDGVLVFYTNNSTSEIDQLIQTATETSENICELCGAKGTLEQGDFYWLTRCAAHR
jgi:hypothetical protein